MIKSPPSSEKHSSSLVPSPFLSPANCRCMHLSASAYIASTLPNFSSFRGRPWSSRFVTYAEVRRFRCADCGATGSTASPETEPGFRLSQIAADGIVEASIKVGMKRAGETAGIDAASVSRLVAARAERVLEVTARPRIARAETLDGGVVAITDAWTGEVSACFSGGDDPKLLPWLSRPYPSVILPAADLMAQSIRWTALKVSIAAETALSVVSPLVEKARQRVIANSRNAEAIVATLKEVVVALVRRCGISCEPVNVCTQPWKATTSVWQGRPYRGGCAIAPVSGPMFSHLFSGFYPPTMNVSSITASALRQSPNGDLGFQDQPT
jgi:hypothetical protein